MKASDLEKVQGLLVSFSKCKGWLEYVDAMLEPDIHRPWREFVVAIDERQMAVKVSSDTGREVLTILKRHAENKVADIEAELRAMGVEP